MESNKVNFDLDELQPKELIEIYDSISEFLSFLEEKKIEKEEEIEEDDDE